MSSKMAAGLCRTVIDRTIRAIFCRVRAPGNPAGHCFVAGRFDKVFSKIPQIARFCLGNFYRRVPRAIIRLNRGSPARVAGHPTGLLIILPHTILLHSDGAALSTNPLFQARARQSLVHIFPPIFCSLAFTKETVLLGLIDLFLNQFAKLWGQVDLSCFQQQLRWIVL